MSDRFGRRGPLLVGTLVYTLGSAACALSPSLLWLSVFRAATAIGASASMVIPRAMVRDLSDGLAAARLMSKLMLVMGVAPILAPSLGSAVLGFASWRAIFWFATAYGAVAAVLVWRLLPETLPAQHRVKLGLAGLVQRYVGIARERVFLTHAVLGGAGFFGMFAYIGGSSPVFIEGLGLSTARYAGVFGLCSAGFITASQVNARILPRFGMFRVIRIAARDILVRHGGADGGGVLRPCQRAGAGPAADGGDDLHGLRAAQHHRRRAVAPCRTRRQRLGADGHDAVHHGCRERRGGGAG